MKKGFSFGKKSILALILILAVLLGCCVALSACKDEEPKGEDNGGGDIYYTLTINRSPEAGGSVTGAGSYASGAVATLSATTNEGYSFSGWYNGETLLSSDISFGYTVNADVTITAKWTEKEVPSEGFTVTLTTNPEAGGSVTGGGTYTSGAVATLSATTNEGYTFSGWYVNGELISADNPYGYTVTANVTVVAQWIVTQCNVSFNTDGGNEITGVTVSYNSAISSNALPIPVKSGFIFDGWFYDSNFSAAYDEARTLTTDTTLYARFIAPNTDVTYTEYLDECTVSSAIVIESTVALTAANAPQYMTLTDMSGENIDISVSNAAENTYNIGSAALAEGFAYKLTVLDGEVIKILGVSDKEVDYSDKAVSSLTISIPREDSTEVEEIQSGYRHINLTDAMSYEYVEEGVTAETENINTVTDIGKDKYVVGLSQADYDGFIVGEIVSMGNESAVCDDDSYFKVLTCTATVYSTVSENPVYTQVWVLELTLPEIDDIYSEFNVYTSQVLEDEGVANAIANAAAPENFVKTEAYAVITKTLAYAISESETFKNALSTVDEESAVKYAQTSALQDLIKGLNVKVNVRTENGFYIVTLAISGEFTIKSIKIKLQFTLTDKIKITSFGETYRVSLFEGRFVNFGNEITNIFSFSVAASITFVKTVVDGDGNETQKETTEDVNQEIKGLIKTGIDNLQSLTDKDGISSILGDDPEYVDLFNVQIADIPIPITNIITMHLILDVKIQLAMSAGIQFTGTYTYIERIGCTNGYLTGKKETHLKDNVESYKTTVSEQFDFSVTMKGMIGVRTGIGVNFTISLLHLNSVFNVGLGAEVGSYAELYGLCTYQSSSKALTGALYCEVGLYAEINLSYKFLWWDGKYTLYETKYPFFTYGAENIPLAFENTNETLEITNTRLSIFNNSPSLFSIKVLNIKTMKEASKVYYNWDYTVTLVSGDEYLSNPRTPANTFIRTSEKRCEIVLKITYNGANGVWSSKPIEKTVTIKYFAQTIPESKRYTKYTVSFYQAYADASGNISYRLCKSEDVYHGECAEPASVTSQTLQSVGWLSDLSKPCWLTTPTDFTLTDPDYYPNWVAVYNTSVTQNISYYLGYTRQFVSATFNVPNIDAATGEIDGSNAVTIKVPYLTSAKDYLEADGNEALLARIAYTESSVYEIDWDAKYESELKSLAVIDYTLTRKFGQVDVWTYGKLYTYKAFPSGATNVPNGYSVGSYEIPVTWSEDGFCLFDGQLFVYYDYNVTGFYYYDKANSNAKVFINSVAEIPAPVATERYVLYPNTQTNSLYNLVLTDNNASNTILSASFNSVAQNGDIGVTITGNSLLSDAKVYHVYEGLTVNGSMKIIDVIRAYYVKIYGEAYNAETNVCVLTYADAAYPYTLTYTEADAWSELLSGITKNTVPASFSETIIKLSAGFDDEFFTGTTVFDSNFTYVYSSIGNKYTLYSDANGFAEFKDATLAGSAYDAASGLMSFTKVYSYFEKDSWLNTDFIAVKNFLREGYTFTYKGWQAVDGEKDVFKEKDRNFVIGNEVTYYPCFVMTETVRTVSVYDNYNYNSYNNSYVAEASQTVNEFIAAHGYVFDLTSDNMWTHLELNNWNYIGIDVNGNKTASLLSATGTTKIEDLVSADGIGLLTINITPDIVYVANDFEVRFYAGEGVFAENALVKTDENGKQYVAYEGNFDFTYDEAYNRYFNTDTGINGLTAILTPTKAADDYASYSFEGWSQVENSAYAYSDIGEKRFGYYYFDFYAAYGKTAKTYTLTFNAGSYTYESEELTAKFLDDTLVKTADVNGGSSYYLFELPFISKLGYDFEIEKWTDGEGKDYIPNEFGCVLFNDVTEDITLTAIYKAPTLYKYGMWFLGGEHCYLSLVGYNLQGTVEDRVDLSGMPTVTTYSDAKNWKFAYWEDANSGNTYATNELLKEALDGTTFSANTVFKAVAEEDTESNYTATFYAYEGKKSAANSDDLYVEGSFYEGTENQTISVTTVGAPNTALALPSATPTKTGATFAGWLAITEGGSFVLITEETLENYKYTSNANYYAQYANDEADCTVTFNAGNGYFVSGENRISETVIEMYYGQKIALAETPVPNTDGYIFSHWAGANYAVGDTTVYAVYGKEIASNEDFLAIEDDLTGSYVLTADLDLGEISPIGSIDEPFSGALYGGGHSVACTITYNGLAGQEANNVESVGLFAAVSGMIIDLNYGGITIMYNPAGESVNPVSTRATYFGGIAGIVQQSGMLENIGVGGFGIMIMLNVDNGGALYVGSFAGVNYGEIKNCLIAGGGTFVTAKNDCSATLGVFVGKNEGEINNSAAITTAVQCEQYADGKASIGGFVGENTINGTVSNSFSSGNVRFSLINGSNDNAADKYSVGLFAGVNNGAFNKCVSYGEALVNVSDCGLSDEATGEKLAAEILIYNATVPTVSIHYVWTENGSDWYHDVTDTVADKLATSSTYQAVMSMFAVTLAGVGSGTATDVCTVGSGDNMMYVLYTLVGLDNSVWNVTSDISYGTAMYSLKLN